LHHLFHSARPDNVFELMSSTAIKQLIWVEAAVESHRGSRVE
jgi:AP-1 complex subunit mu